MEEWTSFIDCILFFFLNPGVLHLEQSSLRSTRKHQEVWHHQAPGWWSVQSCLSPSRCKLSLICLHCALSSLPKCVSCFCVCYWSAGSMSGLKNSTLLTRGFCSLKNGLIPRTSTRCNRLTSSGGQILFKLPSRRNPVILQKYRTCCVV